MDERGQLIGLQIHYKYYKTGRIMDNIPGHTSMMRRVLFLLHREIALVCR